MAEVPFLDLPGFDEMVDLVGDPLAADLVLFMNGNQFMVLPELLEGFRRAYPAVRSVYYETLPPGVLLGQLQAGSLRVGSLTLSVAPDVFAAGRGEMDAARRAGLVGEPAAYAQNRLALLVTRGNPLGIRGWDDLLRPEVVVALPNPATEGIARLVRAGITAALGTAAAQRVFEEKLRAGSTRVTTVHHRQTVAWLEAGEAHVGPVWLSEARWAVTTGRAVEPVPLPAEANPSGRYWAAVCSRAPHAAAARAFLDYLTGPEGQDVYRRYGFQALDGAPDAL
ncbi:Glycine/betaine ABC transporter substrate-binding protein [Candidatus Hydrogenisulfobacillus filiaventi]|uniref:Glycine/betaine ABC transporter substrate-binding protein n=1 Tax=Candidatus Hydrogenisulfobacillus filiaventi TaxID=2707344 RepID=A0A6F8ZHR4_9FIRM|nr:substrate-binding domain-containing protein [Bacillota bacterium]CAB1129304.1 Glycine/betaine ABC transporter substrate-binding protein [Candidatus Hydrogenisulfobacillus filiaventi]